MKKIFTVFILLFCGIILPAQIDTTAKTTAKDTSDVFSFAEVMPVFPGEGGFNKFLAENIHYPIIEKTNGIQGTVYVSFMIEKDGSVSDPKIKRGVPNGPGLDAEVLRVVGMSPPWTPATVNGYPVRVEMTIPVKFALESGKPKKKKHHS